MFKQKKSIICVCEGPSERAYIQELNRFFEEEEIALHIIPKPSKGGQYSLVRKMYRSTLKNNPRLPICIWVDWDRYKRNDSGDLDNYQNKPSDIPDFWFTYMNFEDFLSMHLETEDVNRWWVSCNGRNHFSSPSHSSEYIPEFIKFLGDQYNKGEIPIAVNASSLENLKKHQEDPSIPFACDFAAEVFRLMEMAHSSSE